jgi:hypothetical protein
MLKLLSTLPALLFFLGSSAQERDTLIVRDTIVQILEDNLPLVSVQDDERTNADNVASALTAGRDVYLNAANFHFSFLRFKLRGYDGDAHNVFINGVPMQNLTNGFVSYTVFGGLNDVMRSRDVNLGLNANTFSFGEIGTSTNIDVRAAKQRKQTSVSYAFSNRTYRQRVALTYSSGISKTGWAFAGSTVARYGDEGYMPGTSYKSAGAFIAVDKLLKNKHIFSLAAFAAPTESGRQSTATKEVFDLTKTSYYNPLWGKQSGKKRNASLTTTFQPFALFTHEWKPKASTDLITSISYMKGERSVSGLDWYNAPDPRPDYYRYLPSFLSGETQQNELRSQIESDADLLQINWQSLYDINRNSKETIKDVNGVIGENISGLRSRYIIQDRVDDLKRIAAATVFNTLLSSSSYLTAGGRFIQQKNNYFKRVNDLLGGEFYVDLNQFAENDFPANPSAAYNDLQIPNHVIREGDRFGYDYLIHTNQVAGWIQLSAKSDHADVFIAGEFSYTSYQREGKMQNGLYADHSLGHSNKYEFQNSKLKAGITYKLNGRNYLFLNVADINRPPLFDNLFISPQTRDLVQSEIKNEHIISAEAGYLFRSPKTQLRFTAYYTRSFDGMNVLSFYHDDYKTIVNYAFRGINKMYAGGELGVQHKLMPNVTVSAAAGAGLHVYRGRQKAIITQDNNADVLDEELIYSNNYRIAGSPQRIAMIDISYRSPDFWFVSLSGNYSAEMWADFNPIRRTAKAVDGLITDEIKYHEILDQQKLPMIVTADLFAGYSWRLPKKFLSKIAYLVFNAGVNNLLNNTKIINAAYEQLRFDFDKQNINKFPMKYSYAQGLNYFISVTFRF